MWWWPRTAISKAINHNQWQMQCFLGLSVWLHAGRGRSARLNVAFGGCWQQWWRCAIKMCHSTLVWWLNKANRQCRQMREGAKGEAELKGEGKEAQADADWREQTGTDEWNVVPGIRLDVHILIYYVTSSGTISPWLVQKSCSAIQSQRGVFSLKGRTESPATYGIAQRENNWDRLKSGKSCSPRAMVCQVLRKTRVLGGWGGSKKTGDCTPYEFNYIFLQSAAWTLKTIKELLLSLVYCTANTYWTAFASTSGKGEIWRGKKVAFWSKL